MSESALILTVEDDAPIRRGVVDALEFTGYRVLQSGDGDEGLRLALGSPCDLVLLDLMLPERSGLEILAQVRLHKPGLPVIILTARGDEDDRVAGLRLGADDYVVKPFSVKELLARVAAVLRRAPQRSPELAEAELPGGVADFQRREIRFADGRRSELSEREVALLQYLFANLDRPVSRDELLVNVWGLSPEGISTRTIDMHVARLRDKLREPPDRPRLLLTVRGKGYMFSSSELPGSDSENTGTVS